jgi:hypothetical protein
MERPVWRVAAASVAGSRHVRQGTPGQDAHAWVILPNGAFAAAVADGAGSAELGGTGAKVAASAAIRALENATADEGWKVVLTQALTQAREAVFAEAKALGRDARDLATTLIAVIASPDWVAAAQIGDGASVAETEGGIVKLTAPVLGEYINETTFLVTPNAVETAQFHFLDAKCTGVAALSDGLQMLALQLPSGEPHAPFFRPVLQFAADAEDPDKASAELGAWLSSPRVAAKTDDDLTLVLARVAPRIEK